MEKQQQGSASALLRCLAQLDVDTWASVLLPKLVADGSASDVALTCSQLRELCQSSVTQLNLEDLAYPDSPGLTEGCMDMGARFPACATVDLLVDDTLEEAPMQEDRDSVLKALARLPRLDSINLTVMWARPADMSTMLRRLRTQLPHLRGLSLDLSSTDSIPKDMNVVWKQLGAATQLTRFAAKFGEQNEDPWSASGLAHLSKLQGLRSLSLVAHDLVDIGFAAPLGRRRGPPRWAFLASLTALTALDIAVTQPGEVSAVSSLTSLRELVVKATHVTGPLGGGTKLSDAAWAAVGQLTALTELQLWGAYVAASPAFAGAVSRLTRLEVFAAKRWHPAVLSELQALPRLTDIYGYWEAGDTQDITLPQVRTLDAAQGYIPFSAFPGLVELGQGGSVEVECFGAVAESCPGLRDWWLSDMRGNCSLRYYRDSPNVLRQCVGAITPLSKLTQLTRLEFAPNVPLQMLPFATAAQQLVRAGSLQFVRVVVDESTLDHPWNGFSVAALMQLARLSGLKELTVCLGEVAVAAGDSFGAVSSILGGLCGIGRVLISASDEELLVWKLAHTFLVRNQFEVPKVEWRSTGASTLRW